MFLHAGATPGLRACAAQWKMRSLGSLFFEGMLGDVAQHKQESISVAFGRTDGFPRATPVPLPRSSRGPPCSFSRPSPGPGRRRLLPSPGRAGRRHIAVVRSGCFTTSLSVEVSYSTPPHDDLALTSWMQGFLSLMPLGAPPCDIISLVTSTYRHVTQSDPPAPSSGVLCSCPLSPQGHIRSKLPSDWQLGTTRESSTQRDPLQIIELA